MQSRSYAGRRSRIILWHRKGVSEHAGLGAAAVLFAVVFSSTFLLLPQVPSALETLSLQRAEESSVVSDEAVKPEAIQEVFPEETDISAVATEEAAGEEEQTVSETVLEEPEIAPENEAVLVHKTYTASPSEVYLQVGNAFVKNLTDYGRQTVLDAAASAPAFVLADTADPQVLIMHTHTTECYMPYTGDIYDSTYETRTTDNTQNMAAVGEIIAKQLRSAGIGVLHDTTQHDYPSYNGSYERSAKTVSDYLAQYPSIRIVLDIHRDAIVSGDTVTAPIIETEEGTAAQVMIISGCDDGTMDYPNWQQNLAFAIDLQQQMEQDHPGFTRPLLFDYRLYNQNLTSGSLLIEVGSHGNTLDQALLAGKWIGQALAEVCAELTEE